MTDDPILQPPDPEEINRQIREALSRIEMNSRRFREAVERIQESVSDWDGRHLAVQLESEPFTVRRGGIRYPNSGFPSQRDDRDDDWNRDYMGRYHTDARQGEEVYVSDLLPGARVYVLEDVFTVDRVDMDAPIPTVWLKELPTSPLYFTGDEYIYLANETED